MSSLYPRLVGPGWSELPDAVRAVHSGAAQVRVACRLTVRPGSSLLARLMARLGGLPRRAGEFPGELRISRDTQGELWDRRFGDDHVTTRQWEENGRLVEAIGPLQLVFAVRAAGGALRFEQVAARVGWGRLRIPLPPFLAPVVRARAWADGCLRAEVEVTAPAAGLLCAYEGVMTGDGTA